jgi:beta-xylosidase
MTRSSQLNHQRLTFSNYRMLAIAAFLTFCTICSVAQNPFIRDQFTADPTARVFNDKVYVYPSHDILAAPGKGRVGWFCMEDYHVFSSENLTEWTDHGMIVTQNNVPWVRPNSYSMWAPDCIYRNGKYYFYFPTAARDTTTYGRGFTIGVAVGDKPEGPFRPEEKPIVGVRGIDPNVFIDKDGQAYLYWSQGQIFGAKLKDNMIELDGEVKVLGELPQKGLKEGPYFFERNGIYYLTYPHVENKIERLEYAIGDNPLGPFKVTGVIMDESPTGCWTNHHSLLQYKGQWYLFYHHNDYSPKFDKARSVRADSLSFNADGTIKKVIPTLRGVGVTNATEQIQIDRYSKINGASIAFVDTANTFKGWKTVFKTPGASVQYNTVDFKNNRTKSVTVRAASTNGGTLQISADGAIVSEVKVPQSKEWKDIKVPVSKLKPGVHHIAVALKEGEAECDWLMFE